MSDKANELAEVKRYDLRLCDGDSGNCHAEMYRSDDGDYVEYAAIAAELTRLAAGLESVWAACHHIRIGGKDAVESMIAVIKQREKDFIELNGVCAHQSARLEEQQSELTRLAEVESLLREIVREREDNFKIMYGTLAARRLAEDGWYRAAVAALEQLEGQHHDAHRDVRRDRLASRPSR